MRAVALFGVLLVNMELHRGPALYLDVAGLPEPGTGPLDDAVAFGIAWLGQGKAYTILAFLFGYGAQLIARRAAVAGVEAGPLLRRRLLVLGLLGIAHALLFFHGDVLLLYALSGLVLVAAVRASDATLLWWGAGVLAGLVLLLTAGSAGPPLTAADEAGLVADARQAVSAYTGGIGDGVEQRLRDLAFSFSAFVVAAPQTVALFLLGVLAARRRLLEDRERHEATWRRVAVAGLAVGLPVNLVAAVAFADGAPAGVPSYVLATFAFALGPYLLAPAYVALAVLAAGRLRVLAPLGRLSLTGYLLQSVLAALVFTSYGLERYGESGPAQGLALTLAIFAAEVALAHLWLRRYATGPAEALLRRVTYRSARSFSPK